MSMVSIFFQELTTFSITSTFESYSKYYRWNSRQMLRKQCTRFDSGTPSD